MQGCETLQKARCHWSSHQKSFCSPQHRHLAVVQLWSGGHPYCALQPCKVSDRALRRPCVPSLVGASRLVLPLVCPTMRTPPCRLGLSASSGGWCFGTMLMNLSACACGRAWKLSLEQLRDGSSHWKKVRGLMRAFLCVLFDALHPTNWKQAGGEGGYWSFTGVGDAAALIQVLSRDILSVRWAGAATHWDGAGLERGCDVSIIKQHLCVFENHAVHGALLTAATGACWPKARVAGLPHVELG